MNWVRYLAAAGAEKAYVAARVPMLNFGELWVDCKKAG